MNFLDIFGTGGLTILGFMTAIWLLSLILKNTSIVDIFWGAGFVLANWIYFSMTEVGYLPRKWLISVLVTLWGARLSLYILWRNWGKPEDFRYRKWREEHGDKWWWYSFFQTFLLQGLLMWAISIPLLAAQFNPTPNRLTAADYLALIVWLIGFFFEAVGDFQLAKFKANPEHKGKVLDRGVWRYTRHPNYFGDATQWWAYYLIAASTGALWTIFSPIIMTYLLLRVSGVALLEKSLKQTKPEYKAYVESTSAFIPWFPSKKK